MTVRPFLRVPRVRRGGALRILIAATTVTVVSGVSRAPLFAVVSGFLTAEALAEAVSRTVEAAQSGNDLFQQALSKERAEGKLEEAIGLYARIASEFATDRPLVVKVLLQMAGCYERLGKTEARRIYERIARDYPDQKDAVAVARAHLSASGGAAEPAASTAVSRRLWGGSSNDVGAGSTDGRVVVFTEWPAGDLVVLDLSTGKQRRLTQKANANDRSFSQFPLISPDGRLVIYSRLALETNIYELRIVPTAGGSEPRTMYRNEELPIIFAASWSADGRQLLVKGSRRDGSGLIGLLPADGGALRVVKSFTPDHNVLTSLSPDGRYIVYDFPQAEDRPERDIAVVAVDGSREVPLVRHPAHDTKPMWMPDGKRVVFFSDRNGALALWTIPVADGRGQEPPTLIRSDAAQTLPLGFSRTGGFHYAVPGAGAATDLLVAEMDLETGRLLSDAIPIVSRYGRPTQRPDWSRDGRNLAYAATAWSLARNGRMSIVVHEMDTGREREMNRGFLNIGSAPKWRPDGKMLLVGGLPPNGPASSLQFDVTTGSVAQLPPVARWEQCGYPQWSADGAAVLCQEDKQAVVWRKLDTGEQIRRVRFDLASANVLLSPDGGWLAFLGKELRSVYVIAVDEGEPREIFRQDGSDAVVPLSWTPDSRYLLCRGQDGAVWRVPLSGGDARKLSIPMQGLRELRVHPDGRHVAILVETPGSEIWVLENFLPAPSRAQSVPGARGKR